MEAHGEVTTHLSEDKRILSITSYEGDHDCCYQSAGLDREGVAQLIETLLEIHEQMRF